MRLFLLTTLTMIAFAANSIFCRMALIDPENDPLSFTLVRLFAGALVLSFFFFKLRKREQTLVNGKTVLATAMLFSYALFFSLSYVQIDAGTGALILFACVQLTMMIAALVQGQKMQGLEKLGVALAICGFIYLLLPGVNMPPLGAAALMAVSGVSWGFYSLLGKGNSNPILATAKNFVFTSPLVIILALVFSIDLTRQGMIWAIISGGLTSGLGYVIWYVVLKDLVTSTASIVQLSVPAIAAFGGILFLGESLSARLVVASLLIFVGIFLKVRTKAETTDV